MKILKTLFFPNDKGKRCSFLTTNEAFMYSFLTHGRFVSLRNFISVSNNPMKTLTTQKSIVWSELKYV
ncbi:hypothetical protein pdam_00018292 [Pocillopora damicornis]|uniref:Uncharacterized protein n=1 Tax=Pocillopora damicornis TaxID=46731 RepID=A0A3M6V668_POCDA|nr:hypothetical protein pdam_00018292 [Pocillopora damicornis]